MATNIAESSITVPNIGFFLNLYIIIINNEFDLVYVIDFCLNKEINYNPENNISRLELVWANKASLK